MRVRSVLFTLGLAMAASAFAAERGVFGFSMEVDSEGFILNPTLRTIRIVNVRPESPAALAGMRAGDEVIEVAGHVVAGAKGREIQPLAEKEVGQSLSLKIKHAGGELVSITMVAVAKASGR